MFIILLPISKGEAQTGLIEMKDLALCYPDGRLWTFESMEAGIRHRNNNQISGQVVELFIH